MVIFQLAMLVFGGGPYEYQCLPPYHHPFLISTCTSPGDDRTERKGKAWWCKTAMIQELMFFMLAVNDELFSNYKVTHQCWLIYSLVLYFICHMLVINLSIISMSMLVAKIINWKIAFPPSKITAEEPETLEFLHEKRTTCPRNFITTWYTQWPSRVLAGKHSPLHNFSILNSIVHLSVINP